MSGGLFTNQLLRETGLDISVERVERLRRRHAAAYLKYAGDVRPLPGARELLAWLSDAQIPWAIATSGLMETAGLNLATLGVDPQRTPVVTRDQVKYATRSGSVPGGGRAARCADRDRDRGRRQHLGHAGGDALPRARRRTAQWRVRAR
jgi:phosphoserine phosphatase